MERGDLAGLKLLIEGAVIEARRHVRGRHEMLDDDEEQHEDRDDDEGRPKMFAHVEKTQGWSCAR